MTTLDSFQSLIITTNRKLTLQLPSIELQTLAIDNIVSLNNIHFYGKRQYDIYLLSAEYFKTGNGLVIGSSLENANAGLVHLLVDAPSFQEPRFNVWYQEGDWHYAALSGEGTRPRRTIKNGLELCVTPHKIHTSSVCTPEPVFRRSGSSYLMIEKEKVEARFHFALL